MKLILILSLSVLLSNTYSALSPIKGAKETITFYNGLVTSDLVKDFTGKIGKHLPKLLPFAGPLGSFAYLVLSLIDIHQADTGDVYKNLSQKLEKIDHKLDVMSDQVSAEINSS